jgi:hypothetical protein
MHRYKKLRKRYMLEKEGYNNEAAMLKARLKSIERHVFGLANQE